MSASQNALLLFLSTSLWAQSSIRGIVVDAATQQPLSGVHLRLINIDMGTMGLVVYGALSDRTGHFSMTSIPPGAYFSSPLLTGFVPLPQKNSKVPTPVTVDLKSGQSISDLKIEMSRRAVIAGRVLDEAGYPIPYATMQLTTESGDVIQMQPFGGGMMRSNELGEFRISGPPGKYCVKATPNTYGQTLADIRTDGSSVPVYTATFFPGAASVERASAVEVAAGEDKNIEIRLNRQVNLTISGTVTGMPADSRPSVYLQYADDGKRFYQKSWINCDAEGRFSFSRLQVGAYRVMASGGAKLVSAVRQFQLEQTDVNNVELALSSGVELNGALVFEGETTPIKRTVRLTMVGAQFSGVTPPSPVVTDEHGFFHFTALPPLTFQVAVEPMPDNGYIKDVMVDGVTVMPLGEVDLSHGRGVALKIVGGRGAGQISGKIRDRDGIIIVGHPLAVFLTPDPKAIKQENLTMVGSDGAYQITGLRPGKYRLFAIDALKFTGGKGLDAFQPLAEIAEEIEIQQDARITKDLTPMEKESADAKTK